MASSSSLWQVHLPRPKKVDHPHYQVTKPNDQHQFNLSYLPHNTVEGNRYKYILTGVDVASRYKVARLLTKKKANDVAFALESIYNKEKQFMWQKVFQCDDGSEFKSDIGKLTEKLSVKVNCVTTKYKHTHTAFIEFNNSTIMVSTTSIL